MSRHNLMAESEKEVLKPRKNKGKVALLLLFLEEAGQPYQVVTVPESWGF